MVNVPKDFQDYDDDDPDLKKRQARWDFWEVLKKLRKEFTDAGLEFDAGDFIAWIEEKYGFRLVLNDTGITDDYEIVDEQKYLIFRLRYD
jgi:hypothetical protein